MSVTTCCLVRYRCSREFAHAAVPVLGQQWAWRSSSFLIRCPFEPVGVQPVLQQSCLGSSASSYWSKEAAAQKKRFLREKIISIASIVIALVSLVLTNQLAHNNLSSTNVIVDKWCTFQINTEKQLTFQIKTSCTMKGSCHLPDKHRDAAQKQLAMVLRQWNGMEPAAQLNDLINLLWKQK